MPLVSIHTSSTTKVDTRKLLIDLSSLLAELTNKPESYVMVIFKNNLDMTFAGSHEPCAYVEVKSIGSIQSKLISSTLCKFITDEIGVEPSRIYIHIEDVKATNWGYNSSTFG